MGLFISIAAFMLAIAIAVVVLPLRHSGSQTKARRFLQKGHASGLLSEDEYQKKLSALTTDSETTNKHSHRLTAAILAIALPIFAVLLYQQIGNPAAIGLQSANSDASQTSTPGTTNTNNDLDQLREALRRTPDNLQGWMQLAQSYNEAKRFNDAADAFSVVADGLPDNAPIKPDVLANVAENQMFASGSGGVPEPAKQAIQAALQLNPLHQRSLWLHGAMDYQERRFDSAIQHWQTLLPLLQDPDIKASIQQQINQAQIDSGQPVQDFSSESASTNTGDSSGLSNGSREILVNISLSEALQQQLGEQTPVLFAFVRLTDSERPPLAIKRIGNPQFPLEVTLNESDAMLPGQSISTLQASDSVTITARLSFTGNAIAAAGDWQAQVILTLEQAMSNGPLRLEISDIL